MTILELQKLSHEIALDKGWWDRERSIGEILALIHSEISEALEEARRSKSLTQIYFSDTKKPEGFPIELADILIRIGDLAQRMGINLETAIEEKMKYNKKRPFRHERLF